MTSITLTHTVRTVVLAVAVFALVLAVGVSGCQESKQTDAQQTPAPYSDAPMVPEESGSIIEASDATFDALVLNSQMPVLVDFYADWCPPCRAMHPNIEAVAKQYVGRCKVVQVNVDECRESASKYGISSIPSLFIFVGGKKVDSEVGYREVEQLQTMIEKHLD